MAGSLMADAREKNEIRDWSRQISNLPNGAKRSPVLALPLRGFCELRIESRSRARSGFSFRASRSRRDEYERILRSTGRARFPLTLSGCRSAALRPITYPAKALSRRSHDVNYLSTKYLQTATPGATQRDRSTLKFCTRVCQERTRVTRACRHAELKR